MPSNDWTGLINKDPRGLSADGLTLATFTTSAPIFPTFVWPRNSFRAKTLIKVQARGIWAATGTPTYTFRLQNTVGTAVTIVTSAAITVSALTNQSWVWNMQIQCRTEGTTGTLEGMGDLTLGGVTGMQFLPATGSAPATATVDTTIDQTWGLEIACSASSGSNTVKGIVMEVLTANG
jgi:hypothetical protein